MNVIPISESAPACYGICCPTHGLCARYDAVETTSMDHTIPTCEDLGKYPLFVELKKEATR